MADGADDVKLLLDIESTRRVAARRVAPLTLAIRAMKLHARGTVLYLTANGVWLANAIRPDFAPWSSSRSIAPLLNRRAA